MCILIYVPKNVALPDDEKLYSCFDSNPDGIGISWNNGVQTFLKKGFMEIEHFLLYLDQKRDELIDCDVLIHFRYATHGSVNASNCHPFVVSDRIGDLKRKRYQGKDLILAHNGIIHGKEYTRKTKNDLSDTMIFTKRLHCLGLDNAEIKHILLSGKFCLMYPDHVDRYGSFIEDDGVFYSNDSYKRNLWFDLRYGLKDDKADKCKYEKECLQSGICKWTSLLIEDEIEYADIDYCPLALEYWDNEMMDQRVELPDEYFFDKEYLR